MSKYYRGPLSFSVSTLGLDFGRLDEKYYFQADDGLLRSHTFHELVAVTFHTRPFITSNFACAAMTMQNLHELTADYCVAHMVHIFILLSYWGSAIIELER